MAPGFSTNSTLVEDGILPPASVTTSSASYTPSSDPRAATSALDTEHAILVAPVSAVPVHPSQQPLQQRAIKTGHAPSVSDVDIATFDSPELHQLKALKWKSGRELTAHVQDIALKQGKRAMVATSGGSFKKFVCSSETSCPWLVNAVCTRARVPKNVSADGLGDAQEIHLHEENQILADMTKRKYWYVSSAYLVHSNCTGMAKPTARQLKDVDVLQSAVQQDARVSSSTLMGQLKSQARLLCS